MGFQDEQDYIMRMIKEVIRVLVTVALGKTYKQVELDAENKYEVSGSNVNQWKEMVDKEKSTRLKIFSLMSWIMETGKK